MAPGTEMRVTIVDYGIGNLFSVSRALQRCGAEVSVATSAEQIDAAPRLVLPGVGAFANGMQGLRERGLVEPLRRYAALGRPLLGICLGMQMLASTSEEFGEHEGLGLIPGQVVSVPVVGTGGEALKSPHIGWSALAPSPLADWRNSVLAATVPGTTMYLVHSFHVVPDAATDLLAQCRHGGHAITAAIRRGNVTGLQFHPEKSGEAGLAVLAAFLRT